MVASLKDKRTPITTPPYQVPSVDVTPDPPIFSLVTTFKDSVKKYASASIYNTYVDMYQFESTTDCRILIFSIVPRKLTQYQ
jgi:hypothetical protein